MHSDSLSPPGNPGGPNRRRTKRLAAELPVTVTGTDPHGEPFREAAMATAISCYGCKYRTRRHLEKNSKVTLEIRRTSRPHAVRIVRARVAWVQKPRHDWEAFQIGLEFERPGNVWSIEAPPADWFPCSEDLLPPIAAPIQGVQLRLPQ